MAREMLVSPTIENMHPFIYSHNENCSAKVPDLKGRCYHNIKTGFLCEYMRSGSYICPRVSEFTYSPGTHRLLVRSIDV